MTVETMSLGMEGARTGGELRDASSPQGSWAIAPPRDFAVVIESNLARKCSLNAMPTA